jgi:hypothetical protein
MPNSNKQQVVAKIRFLEDQLISLDHYLPETYEYLMAELDVQKRQLAEMEVSEIFQQIEAGSSAMTREASNSSRPTRNPGHSYSRAGVPNKKGQGT